MRGEQTGKCKGMSRMYAVWRVYRTITVCGLLTVLAGCSRSPHPMSPAPMPQQPQKKNAPSATPAISMGRPDARVRVEAFYPLDEQHKWVLEWLHRAGIEFGDKVFIQAYDLTTESGEKIWHARGMHCGGILVNNRSCFTINDKRITLLRAPSSNSWSREDLFAVLRAETDRLASATPASPAGAAKGPTPSNKPLREGKSLFMFCAAGLRKPVERVCAEFEEQYGIPVRVCYSGSACLLGQIEISRRGDLYLAGEQWYMDQATQRGYIETSRTLCYFIPVTMVQKGNPKKIRSLRDLARPGIRVGAGEPKSCAIGKSTVELLQRHGLEEKVAKNVVVHTGTAPELGNAMKLGTIDAAVNWDAVAFWYEDACDVVTIPQKDNLVVACPLGVLTFSKAVRLAQQFLEFAAGPAGKKIFGEEHYTLDPGKPIYPY